MMAPEVAALVAREHRDALRREAQLRRLAAASPGPTRAPAEGCGGRR